MFSRPTNATCDGKREIGKSPSLVTWHKKPCNDICPKNRENVDVDYNGADFSHFPSFTSMLQHENECFNPINHSNSINFSQNLMPFNPFESSSSCSPSPSVFNSTTMLNLSKNPLLLSPNSTILSHHFPQRFGLESGPTNEALQETQNHVSVFMNRGNSGGFGGFNEFSTQNEMESHNLVANPLFSTTHLGENECYGGLNLNQNKGDGRDAHTNNNDNADSNNNSPVTATPSAGDSKGKKKPAKNLLGEKRRRKILNDKLYALRSIVPKISKLDRASILGDAIEYMKGLNNKIDDICNELKLTPPPLTQTTNFQHLTPTLSSFSSRSKEQLCPNSLPSLKNAQPVRVEVKSMEGQAINIHMLCDHKPGILHSTMRALNGLGVDIQQGVITCFNGFAMDIFHAKKCKDGKDLHPDQIKAKLLELATFHGSIVSSNCNSSSIPNYLQY